MKKRMAFIILIAAVMLTGCDTTETRTIQINLGGSRAAPSDISAVYIAVFKIGEEFQLGHIMSFVGPPTGSASLVVPAKTDLFLLVMAASSDVSNYYVGEGCYYGAENPESDTVDVSMFMIEGMPGESTYLTADDGYSVTANNSGFYLNLNYEPIGDSDVYPFLEMHLEESSNGTSYQVIAKIPFSLVAGGFYDFKDHIAKGGSWYRARVYFPALGLYFYTWHETQGQFVD